MRPAPAKSGLGYRATRPFSPLELKPFESVPTWKLLFFRMSTVSTPKLHTTLRPRGNVGFEHVPMPTVDQTEEFLERHLSRTAPVRSCVVADGSHTFGTYQHSCRSVRYTPGKRGRSVRAALVLSRVAYMPVRKRPIKSLRCASPDSNRDHLDGDQISFRWNRRAHWRGRNRTVGPYIQSTNVTTTSLAIGRTGFAPALDHSQWPVLGCYTTCHLAVVDGIRTRIWSYCPGVCRLSLRPLYDVVQRRAPYYCHRLGSYAPSVHQQRVTSGADRIRTEWKASPRRRC